MGGKLKELFDVAKLYLAGTPEEIQNYEVDLSTKAYWPLGITLEAAVGVACLATGVLPLAVLSVPVIFDFIGRVSDMYDNGNRYTPAGIIGLGRYDAPDEGNEPDSLQMRLWDEGC